MVLYPFLFFIFLIKDGFNPYDELTYQETRLEGGTKADLIYWMRVVLHMFLLITSAYLIAMMVFTWFIRRW